VDRRPASAEGQFEFAGLRKIAYHLTISAEGFQIFQQDVDLGHGADEIILNIFLVPLAQTKRKHSAPGSLMDAKAPASARHEYEKGLRALERKNLEGARDHLTKAAGEYPCYASAQRDLALTLSTLHAYQEAEDRLKKVIQCDPGFLDAYAALGQLLNAQRRYQDSKAILERALAGSAEDWQLYYQLGWAEYGLGNYHRAEESYRKVQSLHPGPFPEFHIKLADTYLKESAYDKAYGEMETYLREDPGGRFAGKVKKIMQEMKSAGVLHAAQVPAPQSQPTRQEK
jgi:tetratricopeptide (TPR) repeat protein